MSSLRNLGDLDSVTVVNVRKQHTSSKKYSFKVSINRKTKLKSYYLNWIDILNILYVLSYSIFTKFCKVRTMPTPPCPFSIFFFYK